MNGTVTKGQVGVAEGFNRAGDPRVELRFFNGTYDTLVTIDYEQVRQLRQVLNNLPDMDYLVDAERGSR